MHIAPEAVSAGAPDVTVNYSYGYTAGMFENVTGSTTATYYNYDTSGQPVSLSNTITDDFCLHFSAKDFDQDAASYYYGMRFYNPALGRWINRDPTETNLSSYLDIIQSKLDGSRNITDTPYGKSLPAIYAMLFNVREDDVLMSLQNSILIALPSLDAFACPINSAEFVLNNPINDYDLEGLKPKSTKKDIIDAIIDEILEQLDDVIKDRIKEKSAGVPLAKARQACCKLKTMPKDANWVLECHSCAVWAVAKKLPTTALAFEVAYKNALIKCSTYKIP